MSSPQVTHCSFDLPTALAGARRDTLSLLDDLDEDQALGPRGLTVNPPLWELGHVAWFEERWVLQHWAGRPPIDADDVARYDSAAVWHRTRWSLRMPDLEETRQKLVRIADEAASVWREAEGDPALTYFHLLSLAHEDMHREALVMNRQQLGWARPSILAADRGEASSTGASPARDVAFAGGSLRLGVAPDTGSFHFDNEKWAHEVEVPAFAMASRCVTQGEFAAFVDAGGYEDARLWTPEGRVWQRRNRALHPLYWRRGPGGIWQRRVFDAWRDLEPERPMVHVGWHEALAFCRFTGRRLPREEEWVFVARELGEIPADADLDTVADGPRVPPDRPFADLWGGVWEWTASRMRPFPGFAPDPYEAYSRPWYGTHVIVFGGSWMTRRRLVRPELRNFYDPSRRDPFIGFRTCAA